MSSFSLYNICKYCSTAFRHFISAPHLNLTLPSVIYAVPGLECNIYFKNVIDSSVADSYTVDVKCDRGTHAGERWVWTPDIEDSGKEFELELRIFNDFGLLMFKKTRITVAKEHNDRTEKFTLSLLADSGVNCLYPDHMLNVMRERGYTNYTPVGKHSGYGNPVISGGIAHDGYGGFEWKCFLERWFYTSDELPLAQSEAEREQMIVLGVKDVPKERAYLMRSPLLKLVDGKKVLDIPGWLETINHGNAPNFIIIQLGGNDMFADLEGKLRKRIKTVMSNAKRLIAELRKHAPNAVIGIATGPCGCGQDGFGANYQCYLSGHQYRRNIQAYNRALEKLVKSADDKRLSIVPIHQAIDPTGSYMTAEQAIHARHSQKIARFSNALHPTIEGGYQLGDAIVCWIIKQLENKA